MAKEVILQNRAQTSSPRTTEKTGTVTRPTGQLRGDKPARGGITKLDDPIGTCTVTVSALTVRSGAGSNFPRIGGLTQGKTVQVFEVKDGWLRINYGTDYGWVMQKYTDYKSPEPQQPEQPSYQSFEGVITAESLNVRTGPSVDYASIGYLHNGDRVTVIGESNGWYKINYNGSEAWISGKYVEKSNGSTTQPPAQTGSFEVVVSASTLNVRTGPSTDYSKIGSLSSGARVTVLEEKNGWYKINYNGQEGWISAAYTYQPGNADAAGQKAADYAHTLMNTCNNNNWHYNQNKRTQDGYYDCSAFTARCWKVAGYDFKWANSESQAKTIYNKVGEISKSQVQAGDLLFYHHNWNSGTRWRGINHVAIAIGGGRRIDAGGEPVKNVGEIGDTVMIGRPSLLMQ
ncbi:MAG: SH3 domain-containing protein [Proteobacteria bacterium]|nr:SH3 domain-containing protein [Pseudomonadota bacterium]